MLKKKSYNQNKNSKNYCNNGNKANQKTKKGNEGTIMKACTRTKIIVIVKAMSFKIFHGNRNKNSAYGFQDIDITNIISSRKWGEVSKALKNVVGLTISDEDECTQNSCSPSCHGLLHYSCQYNPPLHIIKKLIKVSKDDIYELDCYNRLPLHIAIKNGSGFDVIAYLLRKNRDAASHACSQLNAPLHLALSRYWKKVKSSKGDGKEKFDKVIKLLCEAAPSVLQMKNINGLTPFDMAVYEKASIEALNILWNYDDSPLDYAGFKNTGESLF